MLFIDGVDILAKHDEKLCEVLITLAKILANGNILKLVLVSREGTIMPYLGKLSAVNRAKIYEVGYITKQDAIAFILQKGIPQNVAERW